MAVLAKKIQVVIQRKNQGRFSPQRNIEQVKLLRNLRRPHEERVRNQTRHRSLSSRRRRLHDSLHLLFHVGRKHVQQRPHELVVVQGPVEPNGEAVGDGAVVDVEAGLPYAGEDIAVHVGGVGVGGLVVDGVGVDERNGEATGGQVGGQVDGGDDVALERVRNENGVGPLALPVGFWGHFFGCCVVEAQIKNKITTT